MEDCIFCKIINGEIPSYKIYEDDIVYAFLDITQVTPGHTLVVPKKHAKDIFEYDEELASQVFARIPKIARALEKAYPDMQGLNIINNNREVAAHPEKTYRRPLNYFRDPELMQEPQFKWQTTQQRFFSNWLRQLDSYRRQTEVEEKL